MKIKKISRLSPRDRGDDKARAAGGAVKLKKSPAGMNNKQTAGFLGLGPDAIFGVFGTNW